MTTTSRTLSWLLIPLALGVLGAHAQTSGIPDEQGVFEYVVSPALGSVENVAGAIDAAATAASDWTVVSSVTPGVPTGCSYRSQVIVLFDRPYANVLMRANRNTAPFAVLDRINVFEDENGVHVSVVNPRNIVRTVLMNDDGYAPFTNTHAEKLRDLITGATEGQIVDRQYGPFRDGGYIGRTMGVMAGGRFDGKVQDLSLTAGPLEAVAEEVEASLEKPGVKWGTVLDFRLDLPNFETVIFGTTGTPLDSRSFDIVKAGGDKSRKNLMCPGIAHSAAYPLEVVVSSTDQGTAVRIVDAMYRMKVYFEDAGKFAFMKNMTMPGSIADEIREKLSPMIQ